MPSRILPELLTKASWSRGSVLNRRSRSTNESLGRLAFAVVLLAVVLMYDTPGRRSVCTIQSLLALAQRCGSKEVRVPRGRAASDSEEEAHRRGRRSFSGAAAFALRFRRMVRFFFKKNADLSGQRA
jgi:hypothetical protein